jgi:hypothetical protein
LLDRFTHLVRGNDVPLASEMSQAKAWDVIVAGVSPPPAQVAGGAETGIHSWR